MYLSTILLPILTLSPTLTLAHLAPFAKRADDNSTCTCPPTEYETLGCPPNTTSPEGTPVQQRYAVRQFYTKLFSGQPALAFESYTARNFINHAPDVTGDGIVAAQKAINGLLAESREEILNIIVGKNETDVTFAHVYFKGVNKYGTGAIQEFWRLQGTCLVEHWNVAEQASGTNTSNPKAFF